MKAVVCQNAELSVVDLPEPVPGKAQVLLDVQRCGICGSDLHLYRGGRYITNSADHEGLGSWWEKQHPLARWGGRWGDGNHYSFQWQGRK